MSLSNKIINNVAQFVTFRNMWLLAVILLIPLALLILCEYWYVKHLEKFDSKYWDITYEILSFIIKYLMRFEFLLFLILYAYIWVTH